MEARAGRRRLQSRVMAEPSGTWPPGDELKASCRLPGNPMAAAIEAWPAKVYPVLHALVGPRVPDLRGLFLRGHGAQSHVQENGSTVGETETWHESRPLGTVQGDAIRQILGTIPSYVDPTGWDIPTGVFYGKRFTDWPNYQPTGVLQHYTTGANHLVFYTSGPYYFSTVNFDSSRVTPVDNENRPVNMAVRYLIRAAK